MKLMVSKVVNTLVQLDLPNQTQQFRCARAQTTPAVQDTLQEKNIGTIHKVIVITLLSTFSDEENIHRGKYKKHTISNKTIRYLHEIPQKYCIKKFKGILVIINQQLPVSNAPVTHSKVSYHTKMKIVN